MEQRVPVIYFLGVSPGRYQPIIPAFVVGWHPERLRVELTFGAIAGAPVQAPVPDAPERRYALREIKQRLHQAAFREAVLTVYGGRCAISRLPEPKLLEAGGTLENAQAMAAHESPRTTKLYDRTGDEITLDEVERITI